MQIDFDADDSVSDFVTVPAGTYHCRVGEIRRGQTRAGDERWSIRLVVAEGQHVGKQAAWDSLVFSARGRARARLILQALGLRVAGKVELEPEALTNREALGQGLLELVEGLTEVVEEILGRLDAHREPHQIGGNFEFGPGRGGVGHHAGMLDQGLDGAERLGQREDLGRRGHAHRRIGAALHTE